MNHEVNIEEHPELLFLRASIDNIDSAILSILFHRAQLVNFVIEYKRLHNIVPARSELRKQAIKDTIDFAITLNLRKEFVLKVLEHLFAASDHLYDYKISTGIKKFLSSDKDMLPQFNRSLKNLDMAFCNLLSERMQLVKQVGEYKKQHDIKPLAKARWENVLQSKTELAKSLGINPDAIRKLYTMIHEEALDIELQCCSS